MRYLEPAAGNWLLCPAEVTASEEVEVPKTLVQEVASDKAGTRVFDVGGLEMMEFDLNDSMAILSRTPGVLRAWLKGLPQDWISGNEGPGTWSPYDVVGHLIHGERTDWIPRTRIILEHGESRAFEPFNRFAQFRESDGKRLDALLKEFADLRAANLAILRELNLSRADLDKPGLHPDFGRVTLSELLATWVAHDLDHVVQIARTMAGHYGHAVGPWRKYLSVLHHRRDASGKGS